jgi:DNA replication and repair protein RecF
VLRQRNKILSDAQDRRYGFSERIAPWNRELFELGKQITEKRKDFLEEFQGVLRPIFQQLTLNQEDVTVAYIPSLNQYLRDWKAFEAKLEQIQNLEIMRGTTLFGPHRDEINFLDNNWDLRKFGSRGQHRTAVIALKIAEYFYVYKMRQERPIFLLDDVYTEIDKVREKNLTDYFEELGQVFLTTSDVDLKIDSGLEKKKKISYYSIDNTRGVPQTERELQN